MQKIEMTFEQAEKVMLIIGDKAGPDTGFRYDDVHMHVPDDLADEVRAALTASELPFSAFPVLSAAQFEAALLIMGVDPDEVQPAIKAVITEPVAQAQALGAWRRLTSIRRDNETMELLKPVFNLTDAMITDAWWAAAGQEPPTLA